MRLCDDTMALVSSLLMILLLNWAQAEPNGYNDDYEYDNGCDMVRRLGYKESYPVYNFPPEPAILGPRRCVWKFVAADGGCTLQFRTHAFERGTNDCEEHFLWIGDETRKRRICEFGEPPRRFTSKGQKLVLSYYGIKKTRQYETSGRVSVRPSRLSGVVRCVPLRRSGAQNDSYSNNYHNNGYVYNVPTTAAPITSTTVPTTAGTTGPPSTTTTAPPGCLASELFKAPGNNSVIFNGAYLLALAPDAATLMIKATLACPDQVRGCTGQVNLCYGGAVATPAILAAAALETEPSSTALAPIEPVKLAGGVECITKSGMCKGVGPCGGEAEFGPAKGGERLHIFPDCDATEQEVCKFTLTLCVHPIK